MDKITVDKTGRKNLRKLRKQIDAAYATWHQLPDALREELTEACDGDSLGSCIVRGSELIDEICQNI